MGGVADRQCLHPPKRSFSQAAGREKEKSSEIAVVRDELWTARQHIREYERKVRCLESQLTEAMTGLKSSKDEIHQLLQDRLVPGVLIAITAPASYVTC